MSKHTAGKWKVGGKDGSIVYSTLDGYAVASCAVYHGRHEDGEAEANAKLISAAPCLLEALKLGLEYWQDRQQRYRNRSPVWVQQARAAIAKATGGES